MAVAKTTKTPKAPKAKKLTVAELKRRLEVGTVLTMVDFHGQEVSKKRVIAGVSTTFVKMTGDGIKNGEYSYLNWPKSTELHGTDDGFKIIQKYGTLRYVWGEVGTPQAEETQQQTEEQNETRV